MYALNYRFYILTLVLSLSTTSLMGCSHAPLQQPSFIKPIGSEERIRQRKLLAGRWKGGTDTQGDGYRTWISEHKPDGTFTIVMKGMAPNETSSEQTETGYWGFSAGVFFTLIREIDTGSGFIPVDHAEPSYSDNYEVLELTEKTLKLKNIETGSEYSSVRVE